jgi:subtilisin family serine protease
MKHSFRKAAIAGVLVVGSVGIVATTQADAASTSARSAQKNSLGVLVARFATGTSPANMAAAIAAAGGQVVNDLSKVGRLAVVSDSADFAARLTADARVKAVWDDRVVRTGRPDVDPNDTTGANDPALGNPGTTPFPDPWHNLSSFLGETNPRGILQWDDLANGATQAWSTTTGDPSVRVAVIDTGVTGSHKEILPNFDNQASANTIPCNLLTRQFGPLGQKDCSNVDTEGHGTWVASRIAGAANGFASNGIAPRSQIMGYKALSTTLGGGLTSWIVDAMIRACDAGADIINMSLGGYNRPGVDDEDTLLWVAATNYCRAKGTAIFASAGNEHVRINRTSMVVGGVPLIGLGVVDSGPQGIGTALPGAPLSDTDFRGLIETPAGIPGVIMVSSAGNANGAPPAGYTLPSGISYPTVGALDQLAYYSSYGSRIDIAAPGGARKFGLPRSDGGPGDFLYGGWGELGALTANGEICQDPSLASLLTFACFKVNGAAFGWLQGTSMSSPNAAGVAALVLAANQNLQGNPNGLLARLQATARTDMVNLTGPTDIGNSAPSYTGAACPTGYCHVKYGPGLIGFSDAYGAGMVNADAAV